jgi:FdhD protein
MKGCVPNILCDRFSEEGWARTSAPVPDETALTLYVNRRELVTIQCTPNKMKYLVLGFLFTEGIISSADEVTSMRVCDDESEADVRLRNAEYEFPTVRTLTSGCGGGVAFQAKGEKVDSGLVVTPAQVLSLMKQFHKRMELYPLCGGIHASALADTVNLLVMSEDIGRHNTLDKIVGECLLKGIPTRGKLLLTTGRVSSEMLRKAARMQAPILVSRTSPTGRAISIARELGVSLVGYARGSHLAVYAHPERLGCAT